MLVDDHKIVIDGIKMLLSNTPDMKIIAEAYDGAEAITNLNQIQQDQSVENVDAVLMDIRMPNVDGLEATRQIVDAYKDQLDVLVITADESGKTIAELLEAGASGYILKHESAKFSKIAKK